MNIKPPQALLDVVNGFDTRTDMFDTGSLAGETNKIIQGIQCGDDESRRSMWAEWAPWEFSTHEPKDGGPWKTYFQPMMTARAKGGGTVMRPDLEAATPETLEYWGQRAEEVTHPVIKARYADLVWDSTKFVTKNKPAIKFAHMAIDSYLAAGALDDGKERFDTRQGLTRALRLALKIQDTQRISEAVAATVSFVERTADDDHVRTYCYLFDNLLPPEKGPALSQDTERRVIDFLEAKFGLMTVPGGPWDVEPHSPQDVGLRLASYYKRTRREGDRVRVLRAVAEAFERRAAIIAPMIGISDLQRAAELYVEAGLRKEAERTRRWGQELGSKAAQSMGVIQTKIEIPDAHVQEFKEVLTKLGIPNAIAWLTRELVPAQSELGRQAVEMAKKYPLQAVFKPQVLADDHIAADVADTNGDPDGEAVWRTSQHLQLQRMWMRWGFDHLIEAMHLTADQTVEFIAGCPLYEAERLPLIRAGIQAHLDEDYVKSVHVLVPQIEKALVNLLYLTGGATVKRHQSGRGVMQQKSVNDVLRHPDDPLANANTVKALGSDLRVYLIATLSHPKGLNIRNQVCHGLWSADNFSKTAGEHVLHALLTVAMLRKAEDASADSGAAAPNISPDA